MENFVTGMPKQITSNRGKNLEEMNLLQGQAEGVPNVNDDGDPICHSKIPHCEIVQGQEGFSLNNTCKGTTKKDLPDRFLTTIAEETKEIGIRRGEERKDV